MPPAKPLVLAALSAAVILTGCSSSKPAASVSTTTTGPTTAPTTVAPTSTPTTSPTTVATVPTTAPTTVASGSTTTLFASGPVPAVTGAATLSKEPTIAAGSGSPPSKLTGKDLVIGTGTTATSAGTVTVQYVGALWTTGKVFDASWTDQGPVSFPLNGVIPGFRDAIIGMKIGGRREIVIPPALGYGASGQPPSIPGNATLVFVIDLLAVQP